MLVLVPVVFLINGLTDGDWLEAGYLRKCGRGINSRNVANDYSQPCKRAVIMAKEK